ncbi:putative transcription factor FAR family [Dioscorea sansibarensis]
MAFKSFEEAIEFYEKYARRRGFGVRIAHSNYFKDGRCRHIMAACNKSGKTQYKTPYFHLSRPVVKTDCQARIKLAKWADGLVHVKEFKDEHNHELTPLLAQSNPSKKRRKFFGDNVGESIQPDSSSQEVAQACEQENLPSREKEGQENIEGVRKLSLKKGDIDAISRFVVDMQTRNSYFFHLMDLNSNGCLKNVFWADGRSRTAYQYFGDVLFVDTTCLTDKYDLPLISFLGVNHHGQLVLLGCGLLSDDTVEAHVWLFQAWLSCMFGRPPASIVTHHSEALKGAVSKIFPSSYHCLDLRYVMKRIRENLRELGDYKEIKKDIKKVVYDSLTGDEFVGGWNKVVGKYTLEDNEWLKSLYNDRHLWVPVFVKETFLAGLYTSQRSEILKSFHDGYIHPRLSLQQFLDKYEMVLKGKCGKEFNADAESLHKSPLLLTRLYMEEQASKVYTAGIFRKFQVELKALVHCVSAIVKADDPVYIFEVKERLRSKDGKTMEQKIYEVLYNLTDLDVRCICCSFQSRGILCRHALSVLSFQDVVEIPSKYILERWRKDFKHLRALNFFSDKMEADGPTERRENFYKHCLKLAEIGLIFEEKYEFALKVVNEAMRKLLTDDAVRKDSESKAVPLEGMVNHNMVDMTINDNEDMDNEDYAIHNPMQVREGVNYPQFEFFQHTSQSEPHPVSYLSTPHWNIQQISQETQLPRSTHDSRPW